MKTRRLALDQYETPNHYTEALVKVIGPVRGLVYDCCAGRGDIVQYLNLRAGVPLKRLTTNDLDRKMGCSWHRDATLGEHWGELGFNWIITNPPFNQELAILRHALRFGKNVAFLARISFLEPTLTRRKFWRRYASGLEVVLLPRYSFRKNSEGKKATDSATCCWLIWRERKAEDRVSFSHVRP